MCCPQSTFKNHVWPSHITLAHLCAKLLRNTVMPWESTSRWYLVPVGRWLKAQHLCRNKVNQSQPASNANKTPSSSSPTMSIQSLSWYQQLNHVCSQCSLLSGLCVHFGLVLIWLRPILVVPWVLWTSQMKLFEGSASQLDFLSIFPLPVFFYYVQSYL